MGMFDYVKCEYPLPDESHQNLGFQTKDTDAQYLEVYRFTKDGRLIHETRAYSTVPPDERPYPDPNDYRHCFGMIKSTATGDKDTEFHGDLYFYAHDSSDEFIEYVARFTEGTVTKVTRIPSNPTQEGK